VFGGVQWVASASLVVGLLWLAVLWGLVWLQFPQPPTPRWREIPLPSLLTLGGAVVGPVVAVLGRRLTAVGARRRGRRARQSLADQVTVVIDDGVVAPVSAELGRLSDLRRALERL
jgi:hypothetical protein